MLSPYKSLPGGLASGFAIGWIPPQPFPGDQRAVGSEQRQIGRFVAPIGAIWPLLEHINEEARPTVMGLDLRIEEWIPRM